MNSADGDTIRIFVTSDNHLGFLENDQVRGADSFCSFEECLSIAHENKSDMCIFGGDLFHEHKPSLKTMWKTVDILKKYVMGPAEKNLTILSDRKKSSPSHPFQSANIDDENLRVCLPIFTIHGNHDDVLSGVSPLNLLSSTGLLNYFGHTADLENIELEPILIKKGRTRIALYGLGHIRDERLHRCFSLGKISLKLPVDKNSTVATKWFRILVLHQNRGVRVTGSKTGIMEHMLSGMADLVIWGNEHQQRIVPVEVCMPGSKERSFDIIQPGSTVMTSLHSDETSPKAGCIIEVRDNSFRVHVHPLHSIRPFMSSFVSLQKENIPRQKEEVEKFLISKVEEMRVACKDFPMSKHELEKNPALAIPLLRLNVDYSSTVGHAYPFVHQARFGQHFIGTVANPQSIISEAKQSKMSDGAKPQSYRAYTQEISTRDVKVKIEDLLKESTKNVCTMLSEDALASAICLFTEKDEKNAIENTIKELVESCQKAVWHDIQGIIRDGKPFHIDERELTQKINLHKLQVIDANIKNEDTLDEMHKNSENIAIKEESSQDIFHENNQQKESDKILIDTDEYINLRNMPVHEKKGKRMPSKSVSKRSRKET